MTKEEKKRLSLARAKSTAIGRFLCRLFGDDAGQAMMEYVVIGVLIVAAVVGVVVLFGDNIQTNFKIMVYTLTGNQAKVQELRNAQRERNTSEEQRIDSEHENTRGDADSSGNSEGGGSDS